MTPTCESCGARIAPNADRSSRCRPCERIALGTRIRREVDAVIPRAFWKGLGSARPSWRRYLLVPLLPIVSFVFTIMLLLVLDGA